MAKARVIQFDSKVDVRGMLSVMERPATLPFEVNRFFIVSGVPHNEIRGVHAHKLCHQLLVCVAGQVSASYDDGTTRRTVELSPKAGALYMPPCTWGSQYAYSDDAVLLVLASHPYDPEDYIHDYEEFIAHINQTG